MGYRLEPGGLWKGDYLVADLEHMQRGLRKPSIHQIKRIFKNNQEPYVFPMLTSYDAWTRTIRDDRRPDLKPKRRIGDEFDFDEGPDEDDDDGQPDEGGANPREPFETRLSEKVVMYASQITGSDTTRTAPGIASTLKCGRSSSGRPMPTRLREIYVQTEREMCLREERRREL